MKIFKQLKKTQKSFDEIHTATAAMRVVVDSGGGTENEDAIKGILESAPKADKGLLPKVEQNQVVLIKSNTKSIK